MTGADELVASLLASTRNWKRKKGLVAIWFGQVCSLELVPPRQKWALCQSCHLSLRIRGLNWHWLTGTSQGPAANCCGLGWLREEHRGKRVHSLKAIQVFCKDDKRDGAPIRLCAKS